MPLPLSPKTARCWVSDIALLLGRMFGRAIGVSWWGGWSLSYIVSRQYKWLVERPAGAGRSTYARFEGMDVERPLPNLQND